MSLSEELAMVFSPQLRSLLCASSAKRLLVVRPVLSERVGGRVIVGLLDSADGVVRFEESVISLIEMTHPAAASQEDPRNTPYGRQAE